jgi:carboxymethylproline synthase
MSEMSHFSREGINAKLENRILTLSFAHEKTTNPFSRIMTRSLLELSFLISESTEVDALILTGGENRSFSVGGDFNDVSVLKETQEIRTYLFEIIDLYIALLSIRIPLIAAIDHHAIGQGLQVALMGDVRIATTRAKLQMPELKNGVACPLGVAILDEFLGRGAMLNLVIFGESATADQALKLNLVNDVCEPQHLISQALKTANDLSRFPRTPFQTTKAIYNQKLIDRLNLCREQAANAHVLSFQNKSGAQHFDRVLGRTPSSP